MTALELTQEIACVLDKKKAKDIKAIYIRDLTILADYFIICTGTSTTQVKALADEVEYQMKTKFALTPARVEGYQSSSWILVDYGNVVVHFFLEDTAISIPWNGSGRTDSPSSRRNCLQRLRRKKRNEVRLWEDRKKVAGYLGGKGRFTRKTTIPNRNFMRWWSFPTSGQGLHVGHPRSYTALDIVARKKRLEALMSSIPWGGTRSACPRKTSPSKPRAS